MKKNLLLLALLLCICLPSMAELYGGVKALNEIKRRPLLVLLEEGETPKEKAQAEKFNQMLKSAVEEHWKMHKKITYITKKDLTAYRQKKTKELGSHAVLALTAWEVTKTSSGQFGTTRYSVGESIALSVGLLEYVVKNYYSYHHPIPTKKLSPGYLVSSMLQTQNYIEKSIKINVPMNYMKESKANASELKEVTLLIDESTLRSGMTEQKIEQTYGLPFRVVTSEEVEDAMVNKIPGLAYVYFLPADLNHPNLMIQVVVDTEKGRVLGCSTPPFFRFGASYGSKIGGGHLKEYAQFNKKLKS